MKRATWLLVSSLFASLAHADVLEVCGNGKDDNVNGETDEGCYTSMQRGVCESPLSCTDTGWVSWSVGSLHYDLPPDVAPATPWGPHIGFRRFYTSQYAPPSTTDINRTPLGPRWQHNYMSWIDVTPNPNERIVHTPQGEDVRATFVIELAGWRKYKPQAGHHFDLWERADGGEYQVITPTNERMVFDATRRLVEVRDRVAPPNTGTVRITWHATAKAVETVTDATGRRRLLFSYDANAKLTKVDFQLATTTPPWTTHHTSEYGYVGGALSTVKLGGEAAQTNVYTGGYLSQIKDGEGKQIVAFKYTATPGQVLAVDTTDGTVGFDYVPAREGTCKDTVGANKTALYFNKANTTSCASDAACGVGLLCSGNATTPGSCFRAARCLAIDANTNVTSVAPIGLANDACTGACAAVTEYIWNASLDIQAIKDASAKFISTLYNDVGLPKKIVIGDNDGDATTTGLGHEILFVYDANVPGRLVSIYQPSTAGGSQVRTFGYDAASGEVSVDMRSGYTLDYNLDGEPDELFAMTSRTYDVHGRVVMVDGPLAGSDDAVTYAYDDGASTDAQNYGFLRTTNHYIKWPLTSLQRTVRDRDAFGNVTDWEEPDGTRSCRSFNARGLRVETREKMAGGSCTASDASDLVEAYTWDSNRRLTMRKRADGACTTYEYDAKGRLARSKRRDDCVATSAGPREEYVYDVEGLLTGIDTYDANNVVTRKVLASYYDSRQLQAMIDPVDTSKRTTLAYAANGELTSVIDAGDLAETKLAFDNKSQVSKIERGAAQWLLARDPMMNLAEVKDPDQRKIELTYDDFGNIVQRIVPSGPTVRIRYSADGFPITWTNGGGSTTYERDALGRVTKANFPGGCTSSDIDIVYDQLEDSCPVAGGCTNVRGRVAKARVTLLCNGAQPVERWTYYSYDAAGRVIAEYMRDTGQVEWLTQSYSWTKAGDLETATMPSTAKIGWTYGSGASNADTDRVTAIWRASTATPIIDDITWKPYGPVEQYDRYDAISGSPLRMKYAYDLAYRPTQIRLDAQNGTGPYYSLGLSSDAKGRVTRRDFYPSDPQIVGVFDSYYLYDDANRLLCESKVAASTCPTDTLQIKNNLVDGLTGAGDRKTLLRRGTNTFTIAPGRHRIASVAQTGLGTTNYGYDNQGRRTAEDNPALVSGTLELDKRTITYDARDNVASVSGYMRAGGVFKPYTIRNAYDALNRRVFKAVEDRSTTPSAQQHWFFYYDPYGRLIEVRYVPNAAVATAFTTYQLIWLENVLVAYWQTDNTTGLTTKRYVESDEAGRPVRMHSWATGNSSVVWAVDQDAWGFDKVVVGAGMYQPVVFAGQYRDEETASYLADGTVFRPALVHNGYRTYDPFTGTYLQIDPRVTKTWEEYAYAANNPVGLVDRAGLEADIVDHEVIRVRDPWTTLTEPGINWPFPFDGTPGPDRNDVPDVNKVDTTSRPPPKPPNKLKNPADCGTQLAAMSAASASYDAARASFRRSYRGANATDTVAFIACAGSLVGAVELPSPGTIRGAFTACLTGGILSSGPMVTAQEDYVAMRKAGLQMAQAGASFRQCMGASETMPNWEIPDVDDVSLPLDAVDVLGR